MKLHQLILIFLMIFISMASVLSVKQEALVQVAAKSRQYNSLLMSAVDDATEALLKLDRGGELVLLKEEAKEVFFESLFAGFQVFHDAAGRENLMQYIPLLVLNAEDGCYFWYHKETEDGKELVEEWSDKIPYSYKDKRIDMVVYFRLNQFVSCFNVQGNLLFEGTYMEAEHIFPESEVFASKETYQAIRREVIINTITKYMEYYLNQYNKIAKKLGISYTFSIPYLEDGDWVRTIEDISLLAMFQGYPFGSYTTKVYNHFEIAGARVRKEQVKQ